MKGLFIILAIITGMILIACGSPEPPGSGTECQNQIKSLQTQLSDKEAIITDLQSEINEKEERIAELEDL